MTHKEKWLLLAPGGLITIGAGACLVSWAAAQKEKGVPPTTWIAAGTAALAVFNAGISIFGQSIIERVLHELREKPSNATSGN